MEKEFYNDFLAFRDQYKDMPPIEYGYYVALLSCKLILDSAPRHRIALETIKRATEQGIIWHVEDKNDKPHSDQNVDE